MFRIFTVLCLWLSATAALADAAVYRVAIDNRINLLLTVNTDNSEAQSRVVYDASGAGGLSLQGNPPRNGAFQWKEMLYSKTDGQEKHTGTFSGQLSPDGDSGAGAWQSQDGKKNLPLTLQRIAKTQTLKANDIEVQVSYLQFDAPHLRQLNALLADAAKRELSESGKALRKSLQEAKADGLSPEDLQRLAISHSATVELAGPDLVSLLLLHYQDNGGAHGSYGYSAANYAISPEGGVRPFGLWDAVQKSPANIGKLAKALLADLKRQKASWVLDGNFTSKDVTERLAGDTATVTVIPAGLAFTFDPYEAGSFAEGEYRSVIPNKLLAELYRPDGPLASRFRQP
ncbi:MAG: DUF3298 domain-containing protein [Methylococcaceae bacterium]|nr:MAG: DUF3298 domain-containing protein [Methylococcaceae bacterium]